MEVLRPAFPEGSSSGLSIALTNRDRAAFRHGPNTATIRVERALKKGEKCTRPAATSGGNVRYIAVGSDLSLGFGSDLVAVPPAKASQVKRDVKNGDTVTLQGTVAFKKQRPLDEPRRHSHRHRQRRRAGPDSRKPQLPECAVREERLHVR